MAESSTKPYLIRAIHEWCTDNGYTPYLAVAVDGRTVVPREHVRNGEIVLNVSSMATHRLSLGNDLIEFQARFGGIARDLSIPVENVSAIYARENGHGMAFEVPKAVALTDQDAAHDAPAACVADAGSPDTAGPDAAPTVHTHDGDLATPDGPSDETRAKRAPRSRRAATPRLVPVQSSQPDRSAEQPPDGHATPPSAAPAADAQSGDPSDRDPSPGRPRLTRIK